MKSVTAAVLLSTLWMLSSAMSASAVSYEQVQPTPQHVLYEVGDRPFVVKAESALILRHAEDQKETAERFITMMQRLLSGVKLEAQVDASLKNRSVLISAQSGWNGPEIWPVPPTHAEGYTLHVAADGMTLVAADDRGVFYGLQTIAQLVMQAMDQGKAIPAGRVVDWPAIEHRAIMLSLRKLKGSDDLDYLKRMLVAVAALKYNSVFLEFNSAAPGSQYPFPNTVPDPMTDDQLRAIRQVAREHHLDTNLYYQFGGHTTWLLNEPAYADLGNVDKNPLSWDNSNWCPLNPKVWKIVGDMVGRQAGIFEPKWIHLSHDEMGHGEFGTSKRAIESGMSREQLISHSLSMARQVVKAQNSQTKLIIWHDLLIPDRYKSRARVGFVNGPALTKLSPQEIAVGIWDYNGSTKHIPLIDFFKQEHQREVWLTTFQAETAFKVASYATTMGATGLLSTHWYEVPDCTWNNPRGISAAAMDAVVASGAAAWNPQYDAARTMQIDRVNLLRQLVEGLPAVSSDNRQWVEVSLSRETREAAGETFADPALRSFVDALPAKLSSPNQVPFIRFDQPVIPRTGSDASKPVTFEIGQAVRGVHFLHLTDEPTGASGLNSWQKGSHTPAIGSYVLRFEDGKDVTIPISYRRNIQHWNARQGAYEARVAWMGTYGQGIGAQLMMLSWSTDGPARQLRSIEFVGKAGDLPRPGLLGLTLQTPGDNAAQKSVNEDGLGQAVFRDSFRYANAEAARQTWDAFSKRMNIMRPASGPAYAAITLDPTPANGSQARLNIGRRGLNLDLSQANALSLNVSSTLTQDDALTMIVYLGNTRNATGNYYLTYHIPANTRKWARVTLPLNSARIEGKRPAEGAHVFDTLMISFWHRNAKPVQVRISDIFIGQYEGAEIYNAVPMLPVRGQVLPRSNQ